MVTIALYMVMTHGMIIERILHSCMVSGCSLHSQLRYLKEEVEDSVSSYGSLSEKLGMPFFIRKEKRVKLQSVLENFKIIRPVVVLE